MEIQRIGGADVEIVGDARDVVPALERAVGGLTPKRQSRKDEMTALDSQIYAYLEKKLPPQMAWIKVLRKALDDDGIFVDELTQVGYVSRVAMPIYHPRTF